MASKRKSSVLIAGTGAMASLFAGRLVNAGIHVTMLGSWRVGIQTLVEQGVQLDGESFPVVATDNVAECAGIPFAIILTKAYQTERVADQLAQCLPADGMVVTLQNGLGNRETLAKRLGAERVAVGSSTLGATMVAPGIVRSGGQGVITLSKMAQLDGLMTMLKSAGFVVQSVDNGDELLWRKVIVNAGINPLTALLRVPNGALLVRPAALALLRSAVKEATAVAQALALQLQVDEMIELTENVAKQTAGNHSSMLQDVMNERRTEIDAICGAIVDTGENAGIPIPINHTFWQLINALT